MNDNKDGVIFDNAIDGNLLLLHLYVLNLVSKLQQ
jgi:hypothetical protein